MYSSISRRLRLACPALLAVALWGCIHNDIPYARIVQRILAIEAVGQSQPALIDSVDSSVTLYLEETVDIHNVCFDVYELTPECTSDPDLLAGSYDLSSPLTVTLSRYQDYQWTITAVQDIRRWFTVEGQIGESVIDAEQRHITVMMPHSADLSRLQLTSVRLGPEDITTMVPDLKPGIIDLSSPIEVAVTRYGVSETWTISAELATMAVETVEADAWSCVVWVYGRAEAGDDNGFQYRQADSDEWTDVPSRYVTDNSGDFSCYIPHLTPLTEYVVRAVKGEQAGNEIRVTTQATQVLPDGDFEQWWQDGKCWNPWNQDGTRFWDTGNKGASTLGQSNVTPSDDTPGGQGLSACLATRFVGLFGIGKLAAGSIYTGEFVAVDGTNGILAFGRPWPVRPTKLRGYYKYTTAPIDYASSEYDYLKGRPDSCHIYVALTDWTAPYEIRTNPKNRHLFDKNAPYVIAYGELVSGDDSDGWQEFEIRLDYRSASKVPSYIQITSAASKYGDFFTGGTGATLYVDQYSLSYDLDD